MMYPLYLTYITCCKVSCRYYIFYLTIICLQSYDILPDLNTISMLFYLFIYLNHTQWYSREHKKYNGFENKQ